LLERRIKGNGQWHKNSLALTGETRAELKFSREQVAFAS
jgi:hypothetical protein